jgi:hypothetical protein
VVVGVDVAIKADEVAAVDLEREPLGMQTVEVAIYSIRR